MFSRPTRAPGEPTPAFRSNLEGAVDAAILLAAAAVLFIGWRLFWFLTDDSFIAFRYVSNSVRGFGYVWNPPPFSPVEGYTSFLWVALLDLVWRVTGASPPIAANWLALGFGYATLWLVFRFALRIRVPEGHPFLRSGMLGLILLGIVSNRTFLTWLSSGLETAMFNFFAIAWLYHALAPRDTPIRARWTGLSFATVGCALSRPDGLLFAAATVAQLLIDEAGRSDSVARRARRLLPNVVLLVVPLHLLWRRLTYGEWLPNTYYAKVVSPWPESGLRYLFSFALEYGLWVWMLICVAWLIHVGRRGGKPVELVAEHGQPIVAVGTVFAHFAYYTLVVGGDHFEYRVYSHLVPLLFLSAAWMALRLSANSIFPIAALAFFVLASWPIPWTHWQATRNLTDRNSTYMLAEPIAQRFPWPISRAVAGWDAAQAWLIQHFVCMRHQEHKVFYEYQTQMLPTREEGSKIEWREQHPVLHMQAVGVAGWVLPWVAIIDDYGLNDRVIARSPPAPLPERLMAHARQAPPGYAACFRPNVGIRDQRTQISDRRRPLSDADIRACEARRWY